MSCGLLTDSSVFFPQEKVAWPGLWLAALRAPSKPEACPQDVIPSQACSLHAASRDSPEVVSGVLGPLEDRSGTDGSIWATSLTKAQPSWVCRALTLPTQARNEPSEVKETPWECPLWLSGLRSWLVSTRMRVRFRASLSIWHCCGCGVGWWL